MQTDTSTNSTPSLSEDNIPNSRLQRNISLLYWFKFINWFLLIIPILVLYYQAKGLTMQEVFLTQAVFSAVILLLEVPSGYFADIVGRKASLIIGAVCGTIGATIYAFADGFSGFILAEIFLGIGAASTSGADTALLYDTVKELGKSQEYHKIQGRMDSIDNFSEGLASVLGGLLALISLQFPFYIRAGICLISIPLALLLIEPKHHHRPKEMTHLRQMFTTVKHTFHDHKELKWLVIYSAFVGASTFTAVWFIQPYWEKMGISIGLFGILWAVLQWISGGSAVISHQLEQFFGKYRLFIGFWIAVTVAYVFLAILPIGLLGALFIPLFYLVRGIKNPLIKTSINHLIEPHHRATILSLQSFLMRTIFVIIGPFVGWIADRGGFPQAFLMSAFVFTVPIAISLLFLRKHHFVEKVESTDVASQKRSA